MSSYKIINIIDMIEAIGEKEVQELLFRFSCPKNFEIEYFLHHNAIDFANKKLSITYLVFNSQNVLCAYFTLTHKTSLVNGDLLSKAKQKKLSMYAKKDDNSNIFDVSAFLIAQFGKNDSVDKKENISGNELMEYAIEALKQVQHIIGGGIVFLECEDNKKLLHFYQKNNNSFCVYGERFSKKENKKYIQLLKFI